MMKIWLTPYLITFGLLAISQSAVFAEHFFLKDGKIISGEILAERKNRMSVKDGEGVVHQIKANEVIRTLYGEFSTKKVYIYKVDGSVIQAFKVDEDGKSNYFRMDLYSPSEFSIPKSQIKTISNVSLAKKKEDTLSVQYGYYLPMGTMAKNFKGNFIDFAATYSTPYHFSSFDTIFSLSAGYTGIDITDTPLENSTMFMIPLVASLKYTIDYLSFFTNGSFTKNYQFYLSAGVGLQFVFLSDAKSESARYLLLQPGAGFSFKVDLLHLFIQQNYNYLDIKSEPFTSLQTVLGVGYYF